MISIDRVLSLKEYETANRLALRYGTWRQRMNYYLYLRILPILTLPILPLCAWRAAMVWSLPGDRGYQFAIAYGLAWLGICFPLQPLLLRRKLKKLYAKQSLDRMWKIEIDDAAIHSVLTGLVDSKVEWPYFDRFVATPEFYVIIRSARPVFISIPRNLLTLEQDTELEGLLQRHLKKVD